MQIFAILEKNLYFFVQFKAFFLWVLVYVHKVS